MPNRPTPETAATSNEADPQQVREFCGACHAFPPPDTFPRDAWSKEVELGYAFYEQSNRKLNPPSQAETLDYYQKRAPASLILPAPEESGAAVAEWKMQGFAMPERPKFPAVLNVNPVRLGDRWEILVCEFDPLENQGRVLAFDPLATPASWRSLASAAAPAHTEVVDLDGDGRLDVLVACLGSFFPSDELVGSVLWLRARADGTYEPVTLLNNVGRVADVQAADFNGDGKLDLVIAEFGWRKTGHVLLLENATTDWSAPRFQGRVLDKRHGAIHVPVADLNGDGRLDFVALFSQEHETVVAFLSEAATQENPTQARFRTETIYAAPHPSYGSSSIQLVDLDSDGDLDVLYTNGDVLDKPFLLKPYHGVQWLENRQEFPFAHHRLADMPGAQRAVAGDVDGDGDMDIVAVSYLPSEEFALRDELNLSAVLLLEQTNQGLFMRRPLKTKACDHFTCAMADFLGTGRESIVVGSFWSSRTRPLTNGVQLWHASQEQDK